MTDRSQRRLSDRRIVVVGGASGIGRAVAQRFAKEGATVAVLDLNEGAARSVASEIGGTALQLDVTNEQSVQAAIDQAAHGMGGIDGLVNSAGIVEMAALEATSLDVWRRHVDVNLTGSFLTCRATLPWLKKAGAGTIVNIASGQAIRPVSIAAAYAASKGGVVSLTKAIAAEAAPQVRANVVCPGLVNTPMHDPFRLEPNAPPTVPLENYPLRRWATADELADAVLFLTCGESAYITGVTLAVDGGRTMH